MHTLVTISVPEETYQRAQQLVQLTRRDVAEVMAETLSLSLPSLGVGVSMTARDTAVVDLPDDEILRLADIQMDTADDTRLSDLLDKQQANTLTKSEQSELAHLVQRYQALLLYKAEGLAEAVQRGLLPPLSS